MDEVQFDGPRYGLALIACAKFYFEVVEVKTSGSFAQVEDMGNFPSRFSAHPPGKTLNFSWGELGRSDLDEFWSIDKLTYCLMQVVGQDTHHAGHMNLVN
ncbi:MAG TPA: hypothetical protein VMV75_04500 [Sulfuricella sp.]|nr:hypothetical protein [Sulfuricella sp.]